VSKKNTATKIELNAKSRLFSSLSGISKTIAIQKPSSRDNSANVSSPSQDNMLLGSRIEAMIGTRRRTNPNRLSLSSFMKSTSNISKPQHNRIASSTASLLGDQEVKTYATATELSSKDTTTKQSHKLSGSLPSADVELHLPRKEIDGLIEKSIGAKYSGIFKKRKSHLKEGQEFQAQTYYMKNLEYHLRFDTVSEHSKRAQHHLLETFASIKYIQTVRKPSDETVFKSKFQCAQLTENSQSKSSGRTPA